MYRSLSILLTLFATIFLFSGRPGERLRSPVDSVGFATSSWQMDSVMNRIFTLQGENVLGAWKRNGIERYTSWKLAISPHDDYTYAGWLYPVVLRNIKASNVILIGVAHQARRFGLENRLVFESFDGWKAPYGTVRSSPLREKILNKLPKSAYVVHDSMHTVEHSLEAIVPLLQYYNRSVRIIPVLVPFSEQQKMEGMASSLAIAIATLIRDQGLKMGRDLAIVISNDAVHYGDEDWGGKNYAPYGCDSVGNAQALAHEQEIINTCLTGELTLEKIRKFTNYTVQDTNFRTYRWTWCGRYSVPLGLLTAYYLQQNLRSGPLTGTLLGYGTSVSQPPIPVTDLGMGQTAVATPHHWVGYAAVGYR